MSDLNAQQWHDKIFNEGVSSLEVWAIIEDLRNRETELAAANGLLRSAFQIAKRDGKDTNWEAWRKQLDIALVRQHKLMHGKESEEE